MQSAPALIEQRNVYGAMLAGISMMTAVLWMPSTLGALAQAYGLHPDALSRLAFGELAGFLLGTLLTGSLTIRQLQTWVFAGCLLLVTANLWTISHAAISPSGMVRSIAGLGAGLGFGYGLKACAASARPTQSFGIFTGSMSVVMIIGFQCIAHLIELRTGIHGAAAPAEIRSAVGTVFEIFTAAGAFAALVFAWNRTRSAPSAVVTMPSQIVGPRSKLTADLKTPVLPAPLVLLGLLAIGLSFVGQGAIWAFLQTLGNADGFSVGGVANAMSAYAIAGIAGSFSAALAPHPWPRWMIMGAALLVLWCGLYALYAPRSLAWYVAGCTVGGFYWNFVLPIMLGLLARVDLSGRGSVLGGTMSSLGSAIGPLLAARLIRDGDYRPVGWMAGSTCFAALLCIALVERRAARD